MKREYLIIMAAGIAAAIAAVIAVQLLAPAEGRTIPIDVNVSFQPGLNIDTDALHFGQVPPGDTSVRSVSLQADKPSAVIVEIKGEIRGWVTVSADELRVMPGENSTVSFTLAVPVTAQEGLHTAEAVFTFR